MLDFKKVLVALSVAAFGLVGTASAQTAVCSGSTGGGDAVAVPGPIVATTASALTPTQGYPGSVAVEGTTELLPGFLISCNQGSVPAGGFSILITANAPITSEVITGNAKSALDITVAANGSVLAKDQAVVTLVGTSTIQLTWATGTTSGFLTTVTVSGIRVNPSAIPVLQTVTLTPGSTSIPVVGTVGTFAYVQATLSSAVFATSAPAVPNQNACTVNPGAPPVPTNYPVGNLVITNGFPDSMHSLAEISDIAVPAPNGDPISNPGVGVIGGTTFQVVISNLNTAGVNYYVPGTIVGTNVTVIAVTSAAALTASPSAIVNGSATAQVLLTVSSTGTATVFYTVSADAAVGTQTFTVPVIEYIASAAAVTSYSTTPVTASITLVSAGTGYPTYSSSQTATNATQKTAAGGNGLLLPCATTLLFPYVTNLGGFDTGIAITNASTGASTIANPVTAASGTCSVMFYGAGLPTTNPYVTALVGTGAANVQVFDVGTVAPGFSGYVVATCNFQGGHGYAFLSDGLGTGNGVAANYVAVVLGDANLGLLTPGVTAN